MRECVCICTCTHIRVHVNIGFFMYLKIDRKHYVMEGGEAAEEGEEEGDGEKDEEEKKDAVQDLQAEIELEDSLKVITQLTKFIYNCPSGELGRIRTRAMLCQIYHHALHDRCELDVRMTVHTYIYVLCLQMVPG